ncbi:MAG: hypothetical protein GKS03_08955 [Alphaproteobacteria bacterium]|nr:hypothetical protein [Alphaproteobacteria bacterium]
MRMWLNNGRRISRITLLLAGGMLLCACEASVGPRFTGLDSKLDGGGIVVADEPRAVLIAQEVLENGGSAADAAVALGFGLSVTLQSSAGLGGGGLCLVYDALKGRADMLDFTPVAAVGRQPTAKWQVAVPALARGLYALHAEHGRLPWQQVVVPAENLVRSGNAVSRAFAVQLARSSTTLANDPNALDIFMTSQRVMAAEGDRIDQPDLAVTLSHIRAGAQSDFYSGNLGRSIEFGAEKSGASLSVVDLSVYLPRWTPAESKEIGSIEYYRAVAFGTDEAMTRSATPDASSATGFLVADSGRNVVACALTMLTPFGVGLMPPGLGFLLAPTPDDPSYFAPPLIAGIAIDRRTRDVHYAAASGGAGVINQIDASVRGVTSGQAQFKASFGLPIDSVEEVERGQINAMSCEDGLKSGLEFCAVRHDPNGHGFGTIIVGIP